MTGLVFRFLSSVTLLSSPKEAVADPLPKHLLFGLWSFPVQMLSSS